MLLVAGRLSALEAAADEAFVADLSALAGRSAEVGSVSTGAFQLAAAGLLDGREALAQRCGTSARSFQRRFVREVGTSPARYAEQVRIEHARRLRERGDDGLQRVAHRCGFSTVETFHRAFRRSVGVTAGEYRSRFRVIAPSSRHSRTRRSGDG